MIPRSLRGPIRTVFRGRPGWRFRRWNTGLLNGRSRRAFWPCEPNNSATCFAKSSKRTAHRRSKSPANPSRKLSCWNSKRPRLRPQRNLLGALKVTWPGDASVHNSSCRRGPPATFCAKAKCRWWWTPMGKRSRPHCCRAAGRRKPTRGRWTWRSRRNGNRCQAEDYTVPQRASRR